MISIKDISKRCGVSVATVSKALNNQSDISEETKKMVKRVADEMGYMPNASARALRTKRSHSIGVLFVDEAGSGLTHEFFSHVLNAFKTAAESRGYDLVFINRKIGDRSMTYLEHCRYRGVDGVVMACIDFYDKEVIDLVKSELAVVTVDYVFNDKISVISDNVKGMAELVTYIYEMGHRRIAYIHGEPSTVTQARLSSFYRTLEDFGESVPDEYVRQGLYHDLESTKRLTKELLELPQPPTCIIYPDDFAAMGGVRVIREKGLSIPEDISVAGYDGVRLAKVMTPELTTIVQDAKGMGMLAAEKLIELIEHPKSTVIEHVVVEGKVFPGKSVKKL